MSRTFHHLDQYTRDRIKALLDAGQGVRSIGRTLGIPHSTISRELKRNGYSRTRRGQWRKHLAKAGTYDPGYAQHQARVRQTLRRRGKKLDMQPRLQDWVVQQLQAHWSPDEIAGYLKLHQAHVPACGADGCGVGYVSKTAIYEWLTTLRGQPYSRELYSLRANRRKRYPSSRGRSHIPNRVSVRERPPVVAAREEAGHWEGDTMLSGKRTGSHAALVVFVERSSRLVMAQLVPDLRPDRFAAVSAALLTGKLVRTLTLDNGHENLRHADISQALGATVYFTSPYSSWQKGSVENANRMLRRYVRKGSDLGLLTQAEVDDYVMRINKKPRKILGYRSALEVARARGVVH